MKRKISSKEKIFLIELAYKILERGYHSDPYERLNGVRMELTPYTINKVYKELVKFMY